MPPDLTSPCALIDVDDLAAFVVACAVDRTEGIFNATGPTTPLGDLLETCRQVVGDAAPALRPVPREVLERHGVGEWVGPRARSRRRCARTLGYEEQRTEPRGAGLTDVEESALRGALNR